MNTSAFFIVVPEAERLVGSLRAQFDPAAEVGVPAHVTVLGPFMPCELLTDAVLARARAVLRTFTPFSFVLARVARFPRTAYLVPEPAEPFVSITAALMREFPDYPPYGGSFSEVIPHLTVADKSEISASVAEKALTADLGRYGSIHANCRVVDLFENSNDGYWRRYDSFELGGLTL